MDDDELAGIGAPNCPRCLTPLEPGEHAWVCPECGLSVMPG